MTQETMIVGLSQIGASIGLALGRAGWEGTRTGFDPDPRLARKARESGAVERLVLSLAKSCRSADVVILALHAPDVGDYLELLGPEFKTGAVVVDTASMSTGLEQASRHLPEGRFYIGAVPVVSPLALHRGATGEDQATADLFSGGVLAMVIPPKTPEAVVATVLRLAEHLGTAPFFVDAAELDGVMATVENLPALLSAALVRVAVQTPGWREARRIAGSPFARIAIVSALDPPKTLQASLTLNRDNAVARLDAMVEELKALRSLIADGESEALGERLAEAATAHDAWLSARRNAAWDREEIEHIELPESGMFERMLGIRMRPPRKDNP
jgi:prephenate dehydrogenase